MSGAASRPRWLFLLTPRWLGWHAFAVAATIGMLWLGNWQFHRAESGNPLSWGYTFEWPFFALAGLAFWMKTIRDEFKVPGGEADPSGAPASDDGASAPAGELPLPRAAAGTRGPGSADDDADDEDDPELAAYNVYLARLNDQSRDQGRRHSLR